MKKICVIGYPAKHSLSPKIHNYWLEKYGIEGKYEIREIEPEKFEDFFLNLENEGYSGCNITLPFKEKAFELAKKLGADLESHGKIIEKVAGAINTVSIKDGKYIVENTDAAGFCVNIKETNSSFNFEKGKAVILGAGGAARGIVTALITKKVPEIVLLNRTRHKSEKIKKEIEEKLNNEYINTNIIVGDWHLRNESLKEANILVNTTSLGMVGQPPLDINLNYLPKYTLVADIVYRPLITELLKEAQKHGNPIVDGLGMLLYQAAPGFENWFADELKAKRISGVEVTPELRKIVEEAL